MTTKISANEIIKRLAEAAPYIQEYLDHGEGQALYGDDYARVSQQYNACIAALSAPAPKQKLRPMSEAPRDGTRLLLYFRLDYVMLGRYAAVSDRYGDPWLVGDESFTDNHFLGYLPLPEAQA